MTKKILHTHLALGSIVLALLACSAPGPTSDSVDATPTSTELPEDDVPADTPPSPLSWEQPSHVIGVRVVGGIAEFYDHRSQEKFVPRGVDYVFVPTAEGRYSHLTLKVGVYDAERTRSDFAHLAELGYNTVRVFLDQCNAGPDCIGDADSGGLNPAYLDNIADMMAAAKESGLFILFTSNDLPDDGGYSQEANRRAGETFAGYRNAFYLTPDAISATRRYWRDILSGLIERRAAFDAVLGWQLVNEQWMFQDQPPLSLTEGLVETTTGTYDMSDPEEKQHMVSEGLIHYIAEMRAEILTHDPTALVTMGFFAPGVAPGWYVDTLPLLAGADLDFFDFHAYPGEYSLADLVEQFGMAGYDEKPILMGEYGAFRHRYGSITSGARAMTQWVAESCIHGFDGWLHWTYYPANPEINDRTWGFTDENGYLMELFAPVNQPDPCVVVAVPGGNLAYGRPISASSALPGEPPELAVDEDESSQWGAGEGPPQWIEIDLQAMFHITQVRLLVAQYPEGETVHQIFVRAGDEASFTQVHEFNGFTREGDWLVFSPSPALEHIRAIRVYTVTSPSWVAWKEIQVLGELE